VTVTAVPVLPGAPDGIGCRLDVTCSCGSGTFTSRVVRDRIVWRVRHDDGCPLGALVAGQVADPRGTTADLAGRAPSGAVDAAVCRHRGGV
jgi:hypothetical protein